MTPETIEEWESRLLRERRRRRRKAGQCVYCGQAANGASKCEDCRETVSENRRYRRTLARLGTEIQPLLREADYEDYELILTIGEVRRLLRKFDNALNGD